MDQLKFTTRVLDLRKMWSLKTRKILEMLVLLLLVIQHLKVNCIAIAGGRCLKCDDFNRESNGQCIDSAQECDGCKPGFIVDEADPRLCYELELIKAPSDVNTEIGQSIRMPCVFSALVRCDWFKDNEAVAIGGQSRYQYAEPTTKGDDLRNDCSLDVTNVSDEDVGQWTCGSASTSEVDSIKSRPVSISAITTKTTVHSEPKTKEKLESSFDDVLVSTMATGHGHQAMPGQQTQLNSFNTSLKPILVLLIILLVITMAFIVVVCVVRTYVLRSAYDTQHILDL